MARGNLRIATGRDSPPIVPGAPFTSAELSKAQIRTMLAGGFNATVQPGTTPRIKLDTTRQAPPKKSILTPAKIAANAKREAELNKQRKAEADRSIAETKARNVQRAAEGKTPIRVPEPFTPTPRGVLPTGPSIHGIPVIGEQLATSPPVPQPSAQIGVAEAPARPDTSVTLSNGDPAPSFPWTTEQRTGPPAAEPLPWRATEPTAPTELPPPIQGQAFPRNTSSAVSEEDFVAGFPTTEKPISKAESDPFLRPVEPSQSAARPQAKIQGAVNVPFLPLAGSAESEPSATPNIPSTVFPRIAEIPDGQPIMRPTSKDFSSSEERNAYFNFASMAVNQGFGSTEFNDFVRIYGFDPVLEIRVTNPDTYLPGGTAPSPSTPTPSPLPPRPEGRPGSVTLPPVTTPVPSVDVIPGGTNENGAQPLPWRIKRRR